MREAAAAARSQPVASALTVLVVAAMLVTVMLTTGKTVAAEQKVLASIDDVGTRAIQILSDDAAGVTSDVLDRMENIDGIEWAGAFSSAIDATNLATPDGTRVPVRYVFTHDLARLGIANPPTLEEPTGYATSEALTQFGLVDGSGAIRLTSGVTATVSGRISAPAFLAGFEPLTLIPAPLTSPHVVNAIVVIAKEPQLVAPLSSAVMSVLAADDPSKVTVQTSATLAQLRSLIQAQLASSSRVLVLAVLAVATVLIGVILYGLVMMRRKDFGRRRALGATRSFIVALLMGQTALLSAIGVALGLGISTLIAIISGDPLPGIEFTLATSVLALAAAVAAAIFPAAVASTREPIRELRVP
ncbi:lipoprotein ABC transporter permease [Microbacterium sp. VKM Ac-2870]|nr:lipoprotein ABC transporter permease [Microbacterium sp. VKM Ac-2870]